MSLRHPVGAVPLAWLDLFEMDLMCCCSVLQSVAVCCSVV